jgi:endonuclease III
LDPRVAALLAHRQSTRVPGDGHEWLGDDPDADALLRRDGMAMLIGLVLQRGMSAERVWRIPLHLIRELGHLEPGRFADMTEADVEAALRRLPERPRYPAQMSTTLVALGKLVRDQFAGDGSRVWMGRRMADVLATLMSLPGVGPGIAHMAVQELMDEVGYSPHPDELPGLDVKADVHVVRVFYRLGITADETRDAALDAARRLHPAFPGLLDWPAWDIGRRLCRPHSPACSECPISEVCERRGVAAAPTAPRAHGSVTRGADDKPSALPFPTIEASHLNPINDDPDASFWKLLARLLGVALHTAEPSGVAHRFAGVEPHVEGNPEVVLSTIRTVVESALQARLDEPFGASVISLIQLAVSRNLLNPDVASQLNAHLTNPSADFQTADAVTLVVLAIHALGGSRTVTRYGAAGSSHRSLR